MKRVSTTIIFLVFFIRFPPRFQLAFLSLLAARITDQNNRKRYSVATTLVNAKKPLCFQCLQWVTCFRHLRPGLFGACEKSLNPAVKQTTSGVRTGSRNKQTQPATALVFLFPLAGSAAWQSTWQSAGAITRRRVFPLFGSSSFGVDLLYRGINPHYWSQPCCGPGISLSARPAPTKVTSFPPAPCAPQGASNAPVRRPGSAGKNGLLLTR